jgi:DDE superfamily endonuclease
MMAAEMLDELSG